jgi:hypothetical protein
MKLKIFYRIQESGLVRASKMKDSSSATGEVEMSSQPSNSRPHQRPRPRIADIIRSKAFRRAAKLTVRFLTIILILCITLQILLAYAISKDPRLFPAQLQRAKNVLIVTAHPDDETLFFAPSILGVLSGGKTKGGLVVLSNG